MVQTVGHTRHRVTNDVILNASYKAIADHQFPFRSALTSDQGNITWETPLKISADTDGTFTLKITTSLASLTIMGDSIYTDSHWTQYVIHGVPSHIGTTKSKQLSAKIAEEINVATAASAKPEMRGGGRRSSCAPGAPLPPGDCQHFLEAPGSGSWRPPSERLHLRRQNAVLGHQRSRRHQVRPKP